MRGMNLNPFKIKSSQLPDTVAADVCNRPVAGGAPPPKSPPLMHGGEVIAILQPGIDRFAREGLALPGMASFKALRHIPHLLDQGLGCRFQDVRPKDVRHAGTDTFLSRQAFPLGLKKCVRRIYRVCLLFHAHIPQLFALGNSRRPQCKNPLPCASPTGSIGRDISLCAAPLTLYRSTSMHHP